MLQEAGILLNVTQTSRAVTDKDKEAAFTVQR
jgi:hypothetical protein